MRIVILQPNYLGDVIVTTPMLRHLRNALPQARITLLLGPKNRVIRPLLGDLIDDVLDYEKRPLALIKLFFRARAAKFDFLIDGCLEPLKVSQVLVRLIGAKQSIGAASGHTRLYDTVVTGPPRGAMQVVDRYLSMLEPLGISPPAEPRVELTLPADALAWARQHWPVEPGRPSVAVNITGTGPAKFWGVSNYVGFIRGVQQSHPNLQFVLFGHPRDQEAVDQIIEQTGASTLPATDNFIRFAACFHDADYVVTPDTSAIHIACAWQKPVLGLYVRPVGSDTFDPYRTPCAVVRSPTASVSEITVEQGVESFYRLLERSPTPRGSVGSRA